MNGPNRGNQADKLMELFQEVANHNSDDFDEPSFEHEEKERTNEEYVELDILNLPPRREVHSNKKSKYSFSLTRPIVRLTFIIILLIVVFVLFYLYNRDEILSFFNFI